MTLQSVGFVCCDIGGERFAFRGDDVRLVARAEQIVAAPAADGRIGLLHHSGMAAPIYNLAAILGLPHRPTRRVSHVVVTRGARGVFGLVVDRAARAAASEQFDVLPLPPFVGSDADRWFTGLLLGNELSCLLLSPQGIEPGAAYVTRARGVRLTGPRAQPAQTDGSTIASFTTPALPPCEGDCYALSARRLAAVVQTPPRVRLPGAAAFVTGLSWWQGAAVPLLDFSGRERPEPDARYLLLRTRTGAYAGLPVASEITLRRATSENVRVRLGGSGFIVGVFAIGAERVALLDVDALVASAASEASTALASCAG